MSEIYLVRHGQAGQNALRNAHEGRFEDDYDNLSDLGRRQAVATGRSLVARGQTGVPVIHGPLNRQRDTAAAVASELDSPTPTIDDAWKEIRFGDMLAPWLREDPERAGLLAQAWKGKLAPEKTSAVNRQLFTAISQWSDGEKFAAFRDTVRSGLDRAAQVALDRGDKGSVVVVSSGGPIALCATEALPGAPWMKLMRTIANGSVTVLGVKDGSHGPKVSLRSLNEFAHLDEPAVDGSHPLRTLG